MINFASELRMLVHCGSAEYVDIWSVKCLNYEGERINYKTNWIDKLYKDLEVNRGGSLCIVYIKISVWSRPGS